MKLFLTTIILFTGYILAAQTSTICTTPGQNPGTAFPVCGIDTFVQNSVPTCGGNTIPAPGCTTYPLTDVNPFWYKFTCFRSGTLGFAITPHTDTEDYDWELFDVTNQNVNSVYSNINLVVACNWSGESGTTGASGIGKQLFICEGYGKPLWSKMPNLISGHKYLLLVSHFSQTQSGYDLSFGGGTAVITDSKMPSLSFAEANCGGDIIKVKLNKNVKCSSIAANGSDFFVTPGNIPVTAAIGIGCSVGFDTDSIEVHLSSFLPPGNYTLNVKQGGDGNTILDFCDREIASGTQVDFIVYPLAPTPMDSMEIPVCKPQVLRLQFRKPMLCNTVAADGSDFAITGPYPVAIAGASGNCANGAATSKEITINLAQPLYRNGSFTLTLKNGSDGNTLLDECGQQTPAGSFLVFNVKDTVNADFTYQKFYGCAFDTVNFFHNAANGVNSWQWTFGENKTSTLQNPQAIYAQFNQKNVQLIVSNGSCTDTSTQNILLDNFLKADFTGFEDNCPNEPSSFTSTAQGLIVQHDWSFGDGGTSSVKSPTHIYAGPQRTTPYIVRYTVTDSLGCQNSIQKTIKVYSSCLLAVPTGFTPNKDGLNDLLAPLNAIKAEKLDFRVYNRWGQLVFQTNNWKNGWDGTCKGVPQGTDVYVWFLSYVDRDTKQPRQMKGTAALIR